MFMLIIFWGFSCMVIGTFVNIFVHMFCIKICSFPKNETSIFLFIVLLIIRS
jgi:uncharacterized membrane protein